MSEFIDAQDIAIRNRIAVDGRVNPTVEDWNNLLTHIDRLEQENAELREALNVLVYKDSWGNYFTGLHGDSDVTEIVKKLLNK